MLLVLPGLVLLFLNSIWLGIVIAILSTRFYDVPQIVANLLQVVFFSTPIIWQAKALGDAPLIAEINPIYHLVEVVRAPLLGRQPETAVLDRRGGHRRRRLHRRDGVVPPGVAADRLLDIAQRSA